MSADQLTIAVAGASGFVGRPLIAALARRGAVIALSRAARPAAGGVEWRRADLFSYRDALAALAGADHAVYLVHSMSPSDRLVQGRFEDLDLQAADNFARAAAVHGVRQIVYLGGLLPADTPPAELSRHLRSRAEVERALADYGTPLTVLRAGIVLGRGGSSTEILRRMVRRLPLMICPRWTATPTQPIGLDDTVALLDWVLGRAEAFGQTYDIGGPEVLTYRALMRATAAALGRSALTIPVPLLTPRLSRLWVSLVTGAPRALVEPLIESLAHAMVAADRRLQARAGVPGAGVAQALRAALADPGAAPAGVYTTATDAARPMVRSVQRLPAAPDMRQLADDYRRWLGARFAPLIHTPGDCVRGWSARFASPQGPELLRFVPDPAHTAADRIVFAIAGGMLAAPGEVGRFEFRRVLGGDAALCSVHGFAPRLPWPLYVATQAPLHWLVMAAFARHLRRGSAQGERA
ncbi:MAG: NAD(P)H-binding protein [Deltaproteobacteria bacterium]|nr:NAD(P)H-binding protein [Deltaproteobacteria bacterium]